MNGTAGFEKHLDLKMEKLGYSQDRYEFDAVGGMPAVKVSGASQMELRELAKRLAPDFNARVKDDMLVFMPVKNLWSVVVSSRTASDRGYEKLSDGLDEVMKDMDLSRGKLKRLRVMGQQEGLDTTTGKGLSRVIDIVDGLITEVDELRVRAGNAQVREDEP